ncbi:MAG: metal-sulfur cluster assembly factor [Verrucomicrobia bacterium]|nr:metal-sulfur cluster assembly factor [Verrucomicrobiota bacterium]
MNPANETLPVALALDENLVREALRTVDDPELGCNVIDLGLIYDIQIDGGLVGVKMTLTTAGCPMHESMIQGVKLALLKLEPVQDVEVELVWDPPWTADMMTPEGKAMLGIRD